MANLTEVLNLRLVGVVGARIDVRSLFSQWVLIMSMTQTQNLFILSEVL